MTKYNSCSIFNYNKSYKDTLKISEFLKHSELDLNKNNYLIEIDISYNNLLDNIEIIINKLIYKIYFYQKKYILISKISLTKISSIPSLEKLLHTNVQLLKKYLLLEQFINLIKETSIVLDYQNKTIIKPNKTIYSNNKQYLLEQLNTEQLKAIENINGPNLLLAPAGSGKTKTLVNRIIYLINNGIRCENILVLAFNKKAEQEITTRLSNNFNIKTNIRTFHSFGNQIIKKHLNYKFDMDNNEKTNLKMLNKIIKNKEDYLDTFSQIKNNLLTEKELNDEQLWLVYQKYLELCQKEQFYTFDDMLYLPIIILLKDKNIRNNIQNQYQYILVDEFQDLNKAQMLLIDIIAKPQNNLFVVGDDDQMIYRFRGSHERFILDFPKEYGICFQNILTTNYRSPNNIVMNAKKVINYNTNRIFKDTKAFQKNDGIINLAVENDIYKEGLAVVNYIKKLENINYNDIAILYRYHQYGDFIKIILEQNNLPVDNSNLKILNTNIGKIVFNYIKLLVQAEPKSETIYNCLIDFDTTLPKQFLVKINNIDDLFNKKIFSKYLVDKQLLDYQKFIYKIRIIRINNNIKIKTAIKAFNLEQHCDDEVDEQNLSAKETLKMFIRIGDIIGNIKEIYNYFSNKKETINKDSIALSTIHKTKGNEYNHVIYFHVTDVNSEQIEDERRLYYVAVTRPKKSLLITSVKNETSIFLKEYFLDEKLKEYNNQHLSIFLLKLKSELHIINKNMIKIQYHNSLNDNYYYLILQQQSISKKINDIEKEINFRLKLV